ncbi:MAG: CRTAC1 family protein [bacterium]|nr:CRTAC1 family protein [bacterium]
MASPRSRRQSPRARFLLALITALVWLLPGCDGGTQERSPSPSASAPMAAVPPGQGHARMVERLAAIASRASDENPIVGNRRLRKTRERVAALAPDAPATQRLAINLELAHLEMWEGNLEASIARIEDALASARRLPPNEGRLRRTELLFWLGVAHLRLGEQRNCLAYHTAESCILPVRGSGVHRDKQPSRRALALFSEVTASTSPPSWLYYSARWLANVSATTVGVYPTGVAPGERITFESETPFPRFPNRATAVGLDAFDLCGGAAVEDFDADGRLDVLTSTWDPSGPLRYFRNEGDGTFTDRTRDAGLEGLFGGLNLLHADYDGDGDFDVLVLRGAWLKDAGRLPNSLLQNDGTGRFVDVTHEAGLTAVDYPTGSAAFADYDNDGDLDLYVGNEAHDRRAGEPFPSQLFRNEGDGRFVDVAGEAGVENQRYAKGVAWGDYDGDGDRDLYVSNLGSPNRLYRNDGDGTFRDVAEELGVAEPIQSFATWFWDYDNDGALDLLVNPYAPEGGNLEVPSLWEVAASYLGDPSPGETPRLYRGDGRGGFRDVSRDAGLDLATLPMGAGFGDLDNDGYLDFYLGTGYPGYEGLIPNVMYHNDGGKRFLDVTYAGGFGHLQKGHGTVFADLDDDGDQDVFQQVGGFFRDDGFRNALFENPGFGHHWIKIRLRGVRSHPSGFGARIRVDLRGPEGPRSIHRHVGSVGSFGSGPIRQEIGLGAATRVEAIEVVWPATGEVQRFEGLEADHTYEIVEGAREAVAHIPEPIQWKSVTHDEQGHAH